MMRVGGEVEFVSWSGLSRELPVSCRKVMAFGLTAPACCGRRTPNGSYISTCVLFWPGGGLRPAFSLRFPCCFEAGATDF